MKSMRNRGTRYFLAPAVLIFVSTTLAASAAQNSLRGEPNVPPEGASTAPAKPTGKTASPEGAAGVYRIGAGDILQVHVWKEAEASMPAVVVRSDGKISLPIIKEIEVIGLTPAELETLLTERFSRFINGPEVTVLVKEVHSEKIYLVGGVKKEGPIRLQASMTVLQALAEAGGLTDYAKKKKIYVLRTENGRQVRLPFNYESVIKGENMAQNVVVQPGDTIVVPQ